MKSFIAAFFILAVIAVGTVVYFNRQKTPPMPTSVAESLPERTVEPASLGKNVVPEPEAPRTVLANSSEAATLPVKRQTAGALKPVNAPTALNQMVDTLVSTQTSFGDKQALWKKIKDEGNLDPAIAELKQRGVDNPNDAEVPATLGQAELQKAGVISQNGGSINEMGILGLQADQSFDAALKLDPANWEAQFFKAASMSYWPAELNKGPEVVQRFSALIDQQERMPAQPQFAQAYVLLGDYYQKTGQPDYAKLTWQMGSAKSPGDPTLQKKISGQ